MSKILCVRSIPVKRTRKSPRSSEPFGAGILPYVPHTGRMPFTAEEEAEAVLMFADTKPASLPSITPTQLMAQIKTDLVRCKELGRRQDALWEEIQASKRKDRPSLPPIRGGAPRFEPSDQDWDDFHNWNREFDEDLGDDMQFIGACG